MKMKFDKKTAKRIRKLQREDSAFAERMQKFMVKNFVKNVLKGKK